MDSPKHTREGGNRYDVFLSFRGTDTRKEFTNHLYHGLVNTGTMPISVFKDENSIPIGEELSSQILNAITRSKILIPIISKDYASSKWCLCELIQMMDCKRSMSHIVLPIFYKVKPSDVRYPEGNFKRRYPEGNFKRAFHSGKERLDEEEIQKAKQALREVSHLKGWESEKIFDGREGELVQDVINTVLSKLRSDFQLDVPKHLVGFDDHVNTIRNWVDSTVGDTRMIGIYGMGGIGKTTLAKIIYNKLSNDFKDCIFLPDVRETAHRCGIPHLQNQLINAILPNERHVSKADDGISLIKSRFGGTKVLIVLDDIDCNAQLDALARERNWYLKGSLIIITTRFKAVLDQSKFGVDYDYELKELDTVDSLCLFNRHAFRMDHSPTDFEMISHEIMCIMGGLPLALTVIGSYLYGKTNQDVWQDVLAKLRKEPHGDVEIKLRISYDALEPTCKEIFLDIACFFNGKDGKFAIYMWKDCGFFPSQGIEELKLRCLIKIGARGELRMHDQLRDLGRKIVCEEKLLERRTRLWVSQEASKVLMEKKGTQNICAICLDDVRWIDESPNHLQTYTSKQFKKLQSLRFLQLGRAALKGDFSELFSELRWLQWFGIEKKKRSRIFNRLTFSATNLDLPNLVVLQLSSNKITEHWRGWSSIMVAKRLKVLELAYCKYLRCTIDLSPFIELEILILKNCYGLERVHPSIGKVKSLVSLDLSFCSSLKELPEEMGELKELKRLILDLAGCRKIPTSIGSLQKLEKLSAFCCLSLGEIPNSIGYLSSLQHLNLHSCESLKEIPSSIGNLSSLQHLDLRHCKSLRVIPSSIGNLSSLQQLDLQFCELLGEIPSSIGNLYSLKCLDLRFCKSLREIPSSIGNLSSLQHLYLQGCESLREIPSSIGEDLDVSHSVFEKLPGANGRSKGPRSVSLQSCLNLKGEIPSEIGDFSLLENLEITSALMSDLPESIRNLTSRQHFNLWDCDEL